MMHVQSYNYNLILVPPYISGSDNFDFWPAELNTVELE
jgi:hypothetical protein